jgi:hypothetical protein
MKYSNTITKIWKFQVLTAGCIYQKKSGRKEDVRKHDEERRFNEVRSIFRGVCAGALYMLGTKETQKHQGKSRAGKEQW